LVFQINKKGGIMKTQKPFMLSRRVVFFLIIFILPLGISRLINPCLAANNALEAKKIVETSKLTLEDFMADPNYGDFHKLIKKAKGVYIAPSMIKGAFVVGISGGTGVLLAKDNETGAWNGPAFYTIGGASIGIQAGGVASEVVLIIMTDRGVSSLLKNSVKLGADLGVAVGPVGAGASAETANLSADIISYTRSKGLYGGASLEGAVVAVRDSLNKAYYKKKVSPRDILIKKSVTNPQAAGLIEEVTKATSEK
jgi:lipid-binding SYLF domain-containing protein